MRYCTREDVKAAMDFKASSRDNLRIDRAIESASRSIEAQTHRRFYPQSATRYFDWPPTETSRSWRLWLNQDEVLSISSLTSGGQSISSDDYFLEPTNDGAPYNRIEINLAGSSAFSSGSSSQRAIAVTGVFGAVDDWTSVTSLNGAVSTTSAVQVFVSGVASLGVGDTIKVDDEIMLVVERSLADSGETSSALTAQMNANALTVSNGATFSPGDVITVDQEQMLVSAITGDVLTVARAWDGSTLASHADGASVYAPYNLTVARGALGTTASTHTDGATVSRLEVPSLVRSLAVAEAISQLQNEQAGYARTAGSGDNQRMVSGTQLNALRLAVRTAHGRKARMRSV